MSKRKERGEEKRKRKRKRERNQGENTTIVCEKKNEKFSTTDHEENDLEAHVYIFAFFSTSKRNQRIQSDPTNNK